MSYNKDTQRFVEDEIYTSRRYGRIDIAEQFVRCDSEIILKVFSNLIPTEVSYDYQMQIFRVKGLSKQFEPVDLGSQIPYYQVIVQKSEEGNVNIVFKKV